MWIVGLMRPPRACNTKRAYGELAVVAQLPVLLSTIQTRTQQGDITALGKAIAVVCITANDPHACVPQLIATIEVAVPEAKPMLHNVLKRMGGAEALKKSPPAVSHTALSGAAWIWSEKSGAQTAPGIRYFKNEVTLPKGSKIESAQVAITADDAFTLWINGKEAAVGTFWGDLVVEDIRAVLQSGDNLIEVEARNEGQSPSPAGLICKLEIRTATGAQIILVSDNSWTVSETRNVAGQPVISVANYGGAPWGKLPK
jgi:hypothetical protein